MSKMTYSIPYARGHLVATIDDAFVKAVLEPAEPVDKPAYSRCFSEADCIRQALTQPIASERLSDLARSAEKVLILTSDHTRPVPSAITLPLLLEEIRLHNPVAAVKILVGTGFHRLTTREELLDKFGPDLVKNEQIIVHDSNDRSCLVHKGTLPSGGELWLNSLVDWADLMVAEGFIEPHFFAGFSGGRKSVLPGIAAAETVLANHCSEFIASPYARTGILDGNPLHVDMLYAADAAWLAFILNVALNADKKIIRAFAGHPDKAHRAGCSWVGRRAEVSRIAADIVITSNGGYPLDQNIYQAVKGMTAGEACVRPGGVIIMVAACEDGHGGEAFYRWFADARSPVEVTRKILSIARQDTLPDQWEAQILARILEHCTVILVTSYCDPVMIRSMHMKQADTIDEALAMARTLTGEQSDIVVIPDGVAVIVQD
ncbi:MAG: nickel-dependent lactate racemase [Bacillota bacterium]|nr:nickel-dependent lactate racemase [Bacillota bacterium]